MDNTCWLYNSDMSHNSGTLIVALQKRLGIFLNLPPTLILSLLLYSIKWIIIFNNLKINTTGYVYMYISFMITAPSYIYFLLDPF